MTKNTIIYKENISEPMEATAVSIGFFDGVHAGHRFLIEQVKKEATKKNLLSSIITFPIHPRKVLNSSYQPALLCGVDEKTKLLSQTGVDQIILLDFTPEIANMTAREFIEKELKEKLNVKSLIIGYDHRFGKNREEGLEEYKRYGKEIGIDVIHAEEFSPKEQISSSRIRNLIKNGEVRKASKLLSYNYTISGKIIEGFKVGRTIGFPTANIQVWETFKVIPAFGVYAVYVHIENKKYKGMLYIGNRPTLQNGGNISIEVNIFDFDDNLYDKTLTAEFVDFIRPDKKFETIGELKESILEDKKKITTLFESIE